MASLPPGGDPRSVQQREQLVLDGVRQGLAQPIVWSPVVSEANGHRATIYVAQDTLRFGEAGSNLDPTDWDWVRVAVTPDAAQRIADELGVLLPTSKIADLAHAQADVRLTPHWQNPVTATTGTMLQHHRDIEAERAGRDGLLSTIGKDWILARALFPARPGALPAHPLGYDGAINYGWHTKGPARPGGPYVARPGIIVWQQEGERHNRRHVDDSQWVPRFVYPRMVVDGNEMATADVMMSPTLSGLVTYDGPLPGTRYPEAPVHRDASGPVDEGPAGAAADQAHARAVNDFALDIYRRARGTTAGNLALSPFSIFTALAMTLAGARGETASQMRRVLHIEGSTDRALPLAGALLRRYQGPALGVTLRVANRLFGDQAYALEPAFLERTGEVFGAPLEQVDFQDAPAKARGRINGWVAGATEGRIRDLIPAGGIDRLTRLVLANAIYFLGDWRKPFESSATTPEPFGASPAMREQVPTMHQTGRFRFAATDGVRVLELPYQGGELAMVLVLPDASDGIDAVEARLSPAALDAWFGALAPARVSISLPRFQIEPEGLALADALSALGMPWAFDPDRADFTGIANPPIASGRIAISNVFHKAFVRVDENGTEAAAATGVTMSARSVSVEAKPVEFRADHPFLFLLVDMRALVILFMGRLCAPSAPSALATLGRRDPDDGDVLAEVLRWRSEQGETPAPLSHCTITPEEERDARERLRAPCKHDPFGSLAGAQPDVDDAGDPFLGSDGLHAGDFVIRPVPVFATDGHLDTEARRERARQMDEDARAAQFGGNAAPDRSLPSLSHPARSAVIPLGEGGATDEAIRQARARLASDAPDELPIFLHDPVTGKVVGQ
jgi:serpin B